MQKPEQVKETSRAFLIEWVIDVHRKFRLRSETLYVTVKMIDKFLSVRPVKKDELHILGLTCLFVASKYEEIYPPDLKDFIHVAENKFSRREVLTHELQVLAALGYGISWHSPLRFLERFYAICSLEGNKTVFFLAQFIMEICHLDPLLVTYLPSQIAGASLIIAAKKVADFRAEDIWTMEMVQATGYCADKLSHTVADVESFIGEVNQKFLRPLRYKFAKTEYASVATRYLLRKHTDNQQAA